MGAHDISCSAYGATPEEAYKDAVDQSIYDNGHDSYNGTISTTSGCVLIPIKEHESFGAWHERVIEDERVQKWENCAVTADPDEPIKDGRTLWHFSGWAAC